MVDILAIALSHGLLLLAAWRLLWRDDLDVEEPGTPSPPPPPAGEVSRRGRTAMKIHPDSDRRSAGDDA